MNLTNVKKSVVVIAALFLFNNCNIEKNDAEIIDTQERFVLDFQGQIKERKLTFKNSITFILPDSLGKLDLDIPVKQNQDTITFLTDRRKLIRYLIKEPNAPIQVLNLPESIISKISDYLIISDSIVLITTNNHTNAVVKVDYSTGTNRIVFSDQSYVWNSFPYLGLTMRLTSKNKIFFSAVNTKNSTSGEMFSLFDANFAHICNMGTSYRENDGMVAPNFEYPIVSELYKDEFCLVFSSGNVLTKYVIENEKLRKLEDIVFPPNIVKNRTRTISIKKLDDAAYLGEKYRLSSYNVRSLYNLKNEYLITKLPQGLYKSSTTRELNSPLESSWILVYRERALNRFIRLVVPERKLYYTQSIFIDNDLYFLSFQSKANKLIFKYI